MVTDNHFICDSFSLDEISSCFKIVAELSFQDGEFVFHELTSGLDDVIELKSLLLMVRANNDFIIPGAVGE